MRNSIVNVKYFWCWVSDCVVISIFVIGFIEVFWFFKIKFCLENKKIVILYFCIVIGFLYLKMIIKVLVEGYIIINECYRDILMIFMLVEFNFIE